MTPHEHSSAGSRVIVDPVHGYRRLEPLPSDSELERFYTDEYYSLVQEGGRAPGVRRLLAGGEAADAEQAWLRETLYRDISTALRERGPGPRVLDVGCGPGELLQWLTEQGFDAQGVEPSESAVAMALERGLSARSATVRDLVTESGGAPAFDAIVLLNVLEHVRDPVEMLEDIRRLLEPDGLLYMMVPNDFNPLQIAAREKLAVDPWWIAVPDHVNYFDTESLCALSRQLGFEPIDVQADFPMELFLLMGLNYIGEPTVGKICHDYRVQAELSMPSDVRQDLFRALGAAGVGRDARVLVRKVGRNSVSPAPGQSIDARRADYHYVALRRADIGALREFRNAQMDVLRQRRLITPAEQERWFAEVVVPAQGQSQPPMLLVSILGEDDQFVGYGGLTNIDWDARRAEVSFLVAPDRAADPNCYQPDLEAFLDFLSGWAFGELGLNRLFTETYAFRDAHIAILERAGFVAEGMLREHVRVDGTPVDSVMHGLLSGDWRRS